MRTNKKLGAGLGAALIVTSLVGASAFADSRPANETRSRGEGRGNISRGGGSRGGESRRGDVSPNRSSQPSERPSGSTIERRGERPDANAGESRSTTPRRTEGRTYDRSDRTDRSDRGESRSVDRNRSDRTDRSDRSETRSADRNRGNGGSYDRNRGSNDRNRGDSWRGSSRGGSSRGNSGGYRSDRGRPHYGHGRVSRVHPYHGGYRIYIIGSPYPFFVPHSYYHRDRFRVGLTIRLGGYYNPLGYYDYYDGYSDRRGYSEGSLRGVVESVDYRRDTFVIRNEATGSFVTVVLRDRRDDNVRAGDYVELYGDWSRSGVFQATDVDLLEER